MLWETFLNSSKEKSNTSQYHSRHLGRMQSTTWCFRALELNVLELRLRRTQTVFRQNISRQAYWSVLPFSSPGDLPNPGLPHCRQTLPSELPGKSVRPIISNSRHNWLGFCASTAGAQVSSLAGELRSHTLQGAVKEKKKKDRCSKAHVLGIISHNCPCSFLLTTWYCQGLYGCLLHWTSVFLERDISLIQHWFFH